MTGVQTCALPIWEERRDLAREAADRLADDIAAGRVLECVGDIVFEAAVAPDGDCFGVEAVAEQAILRGTGARGLRAILEEVLLNTMYELPSRKDVTRCVIDREVVQKKVNPTLVPVKPAKRQRTEKSA